MNRKEIIETLRSIGGLPGRGTVENERAVVAVNLALRMLWSDMPEALLREEWRFKLEPPIKTGTISVDPVDPRVMVYDGVVSDPLVWPNTGVLRGRWLQIKRGEVFYYRRIQDVVLKVVVDAPDILYLVLDKPWDSLTDTGLAYMIYTYQYPYPADVQRLWSAEYDPDRSQRTLEPKYKDELDLIRQQDNWLSTGIPEYFARGDFFQLPAPRYTPTAGTPYGSPSNGQKWGWTSAGVEKDSGTLFYEPAGTFSYRCVHVWGRKPYEEQHRGDRGSGTDGELLAFYESSPSGESERVTTTWGGSLIQLQSPNVDVDAGYGRRVLFRSYEHYGVEKWWFRARHASEPVTSAGNNAVEKRTTSDGVYYLWKITDGHETIVEDRGDMDPVERDMMLRDVNGHTHIMFDKLPSTDAHILAKVTRRPPVLLHDNDSPRLPAECQMPLINLASAFILGRRDGEPNREGVYWNAYQSELDRLREMYGSPGHDEGAYGHGFGGYGGLTRFSDITEVT
mgnify:FL=1